MKKIIFYLLICLSTSAFGQGVLVTGYVFDDEQDNRLEEVQINVYQNNYLLSNFIETDRNGSFKVVVPEDGFYRLELIKSGYQRVSAAIDTEGNPALQLAISMTRLPGYDFSGTLKKMIANQEHLGELIKDARIEIYNHTNGEEELNILNHPKSNFNFNFERGNRYTVLIRKKGFFAKRFDVLVNVDGCILCFEGLGTNYLPNILDGLTRGNEKGVIDAEIPFRPIQINEAIQLKNIYYDYGKWDIRRDARPALDKLAQIMRATPIVVELGSHTDSRGKEDYNQELSQKRARAAVDYIIARGIAANRISAKGYGESLLLNNCDDKTKCNEKEHQENRRTEFKVTRLMNASSFDNKTLKEIIEIERLNKKRSVEILSPE